MMLAKSVLSPTSTGRSMKNQTTAQQQQKLLPKLPNAVQNQNQFSVFEAEARSSEGSWPKARPSETNRSEAQAKLNHSEPKHNPFSTLQEAIEFLEEKCGFVVVQVEIVPALWKVVSLKGRFKATVGYNELIGFALSESEPAQRLSPGFEGNEIHGKFPGFSEMASFENCRSDLAGSQLKCLDSQTAEVKA